MGMCNNPMKTAGLILAVFSCSFLFGQAEQKAKVAEKLFDKYHKFGVFVGGGIVTTTNESNGMAYDLHNIRAGNLGVEYNFYQTYNFNFKVSLIWRTYMIKTSWVFSENTSGGPYRMWTQWSGDENQYKIPFTAEYFLPLGKKSSINFGLGTEFLITPQYPGYGSSIRYPGEAGFRQRSYFSNDWFYLGFNLSIGLNIETEPFLLKPTFTYHYQPTTLFYQIVTTQNLKVENTISTHEITGNYVMFGLTIIPSRNLFKGNRKQK